MSGRKKLSDDQITFARMVMAKRTEALRVAAMYPSMGELAHKLGCTRRYLYEIAKGYVRKDSSGPMPTEPSMYSRLTPEEKKKASARGKANMAQFRGKLIPQPCERCGAVKAEKHHENYDEPLIVRWLCISCHRAEHASPLVNDEVEKSE